MARFSTAQRKTARSEMTQYRDIPGAVENRVEAEGDFYSNRHSLNSVSGVRVMSKIQSHSTDSHSDDCMSLSVSVVSQRHGQSQRQRDTHSHRHSHSHRITAGCLLLYRNLPVSVPNSNYVYARRYFFAFWPPCCIRFQLVWPYLTEKCAALDITIARFHCIQRVPNKICLPDSTS